MKLMISGVSDRDGHKVAYILFQEEDKTAEGIIPDCEILKNDGFSDKELEDIRDYMRDNLEMLKRQAADVNPFKAMMKD